jgi:hypothetical protein
MYAVMRKAVYPCSSPSTSTKGSVKAFAATISVSDLDPTTSLGV